MKAIRGEQSKSSSSLFASIPLPYDVAFRYNLEPRLRLSSVAATTLWVERHLGALEQ